MQPNQTVRGQDTENMGHFGFKLNEPTCSGWLLGQRGALNAQDKQVQQEH